MTAVVKPTNGVFGVIVLAVDQSRHSALAISAAADMATAFGSEVVVVHVNEILQPALVGVNSMSMPVLVAEDQLAPMQQNLEEDARRFADGVTEELTTRGIRARGVVLSGGSPAKLILETARDHGASLIVVGSHGLSDLVGLLVGSVAHQVVQHAHCPVLIVR